MSSRAVSLTARPKGVAPNGYHLYFRVHVLADKDVLTPAQIAQKHNVGLSTVYRWLAREKTGKLKRDANKGGAPRKMDALNDERLRILTLVHPTISRAEAILALSEYGLNVSPSTISRSWNRQDFTVKKVRVYARNRDEDRRCRWWINGPDDGLATGDPGMAGIKGIPTVLLADADEAGIERSMVQRTKGRGKRGSRIVIPGLVRSYARTIMA